MSSTKATARVRAPDPRTGTQPVRLAELSRRSLIPNLSATPTVLALVVPAIRGVGVEYRTPLARAIQGRLRRRDLAAFIPLVSGWPKELSLVPGRSFGDELDAISSTDADLLAARIDAAAGGGRPTAGWGAVRRNPKGWLRAYVDALRRAWPAIEPIWTAGAGMLDREVERLSVAIARGGARELLAQLHGDGRVRGDVWHLPAHSPGGGQLHAAASVQLTPLIAGAAGNGWCDHEDNSLVEIHYSLPGWWRAFDQQPAVSDLLAALLGSQRARLLLALDRAVSMREVADLLHAVPSAATHHVQALEDSGLVARARHGQRVLVRRTPRGSELVALYERS